MSFFRVIPGSATTITGGATAANQVLMIADLDALVSEAEKDAILLYRTTSAITDSPDYIQISASLAAAVTAITYFNSTGQTLVIATGAALSEVDKIYLPPGGSASLQPCRIAAGVRVSVACVSATTTSVGELNVTFYG